MQNFMKTILSAVQTWTKGKIKESVADWNQNDSNADNYVKNRTHWEEEKTNVIVDQLTSEEYSSENAPACTFVPGEVYNIIWNDVLYENLVCYADGEYNTIASESLGCPFYVDDDGGNGLYIETDDESYTISISTTQTVVHKIDPKYLSIPANLATTDDVQEVIDYVQDAKQEAIDVANNAQNTADAAVANAATLQSNLSTTNTNVTKLQSDVAQIKADAIEAKDYIIMNDISNGRAYKIQMQDGNIISNIAGTLDDFTYTASATRTTITGWNETLYGEPSTEMIVPDHVYF